MEKRNIISVEEEEPSEEKAVEDGDTPSDKANNRRFPEDEIPGG